MNDTFIITTINEPLAEASMFDLRDKMSELYRGNGYNFAGWGFYVWPHWQGWKIEVTCPVKVWDMNRQYWQGFAAGWLYARGELK